MHCKKKKVYSIWICQDVPKDREHTIAANDIAGRGIAKYCRLYPKPLVHYNHMPVLIIGLGDPDAGASIPSEDALNCAL